MSQTTTPSVDANRTARDLLAAEYEREGIEFVPNAIRTDPILTTAEARAVRAIVAALARNAELEAERDAGKFRSTNRDVVLSDPRPLAERLPSYARQFGNETIFARTIAALLLEAHAALADRDALAAENKALREALSIYAHEYNQHWVDGMPILEPIADAALARTPAKGEDSCDSAT